jgi:hypothetical protein
VGKKEMGPKVDTDLSIYMQNHATLELLVINNLREFINFGVCEEAYIKFSLKTYGGVEV